MGPEYVTAQINSCILELLLGQFAVWFLHRLENLNNVFPTTTNDIPVIYKCKCTLDCQGTAKINLLLCFCLGNYIADKFIVAIMKYTLIHSFTSNIASQLDNYLSISFIHLTFTFYFFSFLFECYIFLTKNLLFTISVGMPENLNGNNFEYYLHIVSNFLLVDETYINI